MCSLRAQSKAYDPLISPLHYLGDIHDLSCTLWTECQFYLHFIPSHVDVSGNVAGSAEGRDASIRGDLIPVFSVCILRPACLSYLAKWQGDWNQGKQAMTHETSGSPMEILAFCVPCWSHGDLLVGWPCVSHTTILFWNSPMSVPCNVQLIVWPMLVECPRCAVRCERFRLPHIICDMLDCDWYLNLTFSLLMSHWYLPCFITHTPHKVRLLNKILFWL